MTPSRGPLIAFERSNRLASHSSEGARVVLHRGMVCLVRSLSLDGPPDTKAVRKGDRSPVGQLMEERELKAKRRDRA
jgi:hypothetical protein